MANETAGNVTQGTPESMEFVVGIDGCRDGWVAAELHSTGNAVVFRVFATFARLVAHYPQSAIIGVDVPIGLEEHGSRACDGAAR